MKRAIRNLVTLRSVLYGLLIVTLVVLIGWYGVFQARLLIAGPQVALTGPTETVQSKRIITVTGTATNITSISLNGTPINTDADGKFSRPLVLPDGYTIMELIAEDRYGRTVSITKPYVYKPDVHQ